MDTYLWGVWGRYRAALLATGLSFLSPVGLAIGLAAGSGCSTSVLPGPALAEPLPGAAPAQSPAPGRSFAPVAAAPAVPLIQAGDLSAFVDDAVKSYYSRRADRLGIAMEVEENGLNVERHNFRTNQDFTAIEAHFNSGEELFEFNFGVLDGLGDGMGGAPPNMHRVHRGAHGGPDTTSCKSCHHRGGDDGAGEFSENALVGGDGQNAYHANERNPPALLGGGALQILAQEVTRHLTGLVGGGPPLQEVDRRLIYQDVDFGTVHVHADGAMDTSRITSIDQDLVVRPFGWKGTHSTLRRFAEEAFQVHHGMQSEVLVDHRSVFGPLPVGSSPATAALFQALGDGPDRDPDKDGRLIELHGGYLSSIAVYLTLLPLPVIEPPRSPDLLGAFQDGEAAFRQVGCADCHKEMWIIKDPTWRERGETNFSKDDMLLDLRKDIQRGPQLRTTDTVRQGYPIFPFTDLRRHDMGPELADPDLDATKDAKDAKTHAQPAQPIQPSIHQGDSARASLHRPIPRSVFLTRPLWGLADSAPYLHDGRAVTIPDAIVAHGGEAAAARQAYLKLSPQRQRALHVFLLSLTRPPVPEVVP